MRPLDMTAKYRADLRARTDAARAAREAEAAEARALAEQSPPAGQPSDGMRMWNGAGYYAGIFAIWVVMLSAVAGAAMLVLD